MATYPSSGSLLRPSIGSGLSAQIKIKVGPVTVGAIQSLRINQARDMHIWEEVGTDGIVEIHPKGAAKIDVSVERIVFDQMRITEAFQRGFINIQSQRFPFDIQVIDTSVSKTEGDAIVHVIHSCWFKTYSPQFRADNFIINESANIVAERMTSMRNTISAVFGGDRGILFESDTIERSTDVNGRIGRMDPNTNAAAGFTINR